MQDLSNAVRHITPDTARSLRRAHIKRINDELKKAGAAWYDMILPETKYLPYVIHLNERLKAAVYGRYKQRGRFGEEHQINDIGRGVLVVTDQRMLFVDKKPLFTRAVEITANIISGVTFSKVGPAATVTLHTRAGDFMMRTFNMNCARNYVEAVEAICYPKLL